MSLEFRAITMLAIILLLAVASVKCIDQRIIGGQNTSITSYPYQVSIQFNGRHDCGGSIISRNWILTAAHCVYGRKASLFKIRVGSTYSNKGGTLITGITTVISHELYDEDTSEYDIALIKLPLPLTLGTNVKVVDLATAKTNVATGTSTVVTGWGAKSVSGSMSEILQVLTMPVVDQNVCKKIYAYFNPVTPQMLCAGYLVGGKDTCQGDSGGPLVYNRVQIGIVSWGAECAKPGYPGVYTRVSAVRTWITKWASV